MPKTLPLLCALLLGGLPAAHALRPAHPEELLSSSEHGKVGSKIADCVAAKLARKGQTEAEEDLRKALEKWGKKRVAGGLDPLGLNLTEDLGRALWQSYSYAKVRGIRKGKVVSIETDPIPFYGPDFTVEFALHAPSKYNPRQAYPLVLCLPDEDERPSDHLIERWLTEPTIKDGAILVGVPMPEDVAAWTGIGSEGNPGGVGILLSVFKSVRESYAIDYDRVFIAGRGVGVAAGMSIASMFPDRFAGVIGRSGDAAEVAVENFRNLPTFFAGGGQRASAFAERLKAAGIENCTVQPDATADLVWAWIAGTTRDSNPSEVLLLPGVPFPNKAYWVEIPPHDGSTEARLAARIDRETNTVVVESTGIASVTLAFNDILVDLSRPVKVICNGAESEDLIPRNFTTTLQLIYSTRNDPGKLYTASKVYDIPSSGE
ncbi:MAG: hypothetical protein QF903_09865 [Planctomycetota bacterium]|nr:hypothetical protein [Planctomycetota bacterium]MDP6764053.1 hypothetical protein [Planctomycetota bacterium]MDP6989771.1 hypothetical protein [Planctomycetota bacterium]